MDKAVYKPSDKVQFRVIIIDGQTKPIQMKNMEIYITDPNDNRVKQYEKIYFRRGVFKQEFRLSDDPILGLWRIHVKIDNETEETVKIFEVDQYVLPTFEVKIITKENWNKDEDIILSYSAKYTYGKEVEGVATLYAKVMNEWWWWEENPTRIFTKILNSKTTSVNLKNDLNLQDIYYMRSVSLTISVNETLTGKVRNATSIVNIHNIPFKIEVVASDDNFKPEIPYSIIAFVKDINDIPVSDEKTQISFNITYTLDELEEVVETTTTMWSNWWWRPPRHYKEIHQVITRFIKDGSASCDLQITKNVTSISVEAFYKTATGYLYSWSNPSESDQYIIVKVPEKLSISKPVNVEVISNAKLKYINYVVMGKNQILSSKRLQCGVVKKFKFSITPNLDMMPFSKLIAYYLTDDGEIISDRVELSFESELKNFVSFNFFLFTFFNF